MELYNVMNLLCFFKSADFYSLEIIPSLFLQVLHTHYSSKAKLTLYLCKAVGSSAAAVTFRFCQRGKERRKARNCFPTCFHFCSPKHISYFSLFASAFRISKQWKLAAGVEKRESCVLSVGKFLFIQTTWSFPPERNWLRNTVSMRSSDHWTGESMVKTEITEWFAENV